MAMLSCAGVQAQKTFAKIDRETYIITAETNAYKQEVLKTVFMTGDQPKLSGLQIHSQQTLGEAEETIYFVLMQDPGRQLKVAKILERRGDELIMDETSTEYFTRGYLTCNGTGDCAPQVFILDSKKNWVCGTKMECSAEATGCTASKTMVMN